MQTRVPWLFTAPMLTTRAFAADGDGGARRSIEAVGGGATGFAEDSGGDGAAAVVSGSAGGDITHPFPCIHRTGKACIRRNSIAPDAIARISVSS